MILDIEGLCRKLKPIIGTKADELWYMWLASDLLERKELEIEIQLIAEKVLKHGPLQDRVILLPPPSEEQSKGDYLLGNVIYRDKKMFPLYLTEADLQKQVFISSITGGGKSTVAMLILLQLLRQNPPKPFLVIDWKRQYRALYSLSDSFPEIKKIRLFTVGRNCLPFHFNPLRPPPGIDYKTWISVVVECLEKSHLAGLGVGDIVTNIFTKLFNERKDENFYPNFYDGLRELEKMKVGGREYLWWQSTKRIFRDLTVGNAGSKCFNARNPLKLEELLNESVILELDQEMSRTQRVFLVDIIFRFIFLHRLAYGDSDLKHVLILEECQNLLSANKYEKEKIDSLEQMARQIRFTGQGIIYLTQHISLVPSWLAGNVHTVLLLAQQHQDDVESSRKAMFMPREDEVYFNMLKTGQGIVKVMERINPCLVQFLYVPVKKGMITDDWLKINMGGYLQSNSDAKKAEEPGYLQGDKKEEGKNKYPIENSGINKLLVDVFQHPLASATQRYNRLGINTRYGNEFKKSLISEGLIQPRTIVTNSGWITLFELTQKGRLMLRDLGYEVQDNSEGVIHKYWKQKIGEYYKGKGFDILVEEHVNGKPDIIVMGNGKKVSIEIETGNSEAIQNIEKNLKAGFDEVICVATNKEVEEKTRQELKIEDARIKLTTVFEF